MLRELKISYNNELISHTSRLLKSSCQRYIQQNNEGMQFQADIASIRELLSGNYINKNQLTDCKDEIMAQMEKLSSKKDCQKDLKQFEEHKNRVLEDLRHVNDIANSKASLKEIDLVIQKLSQYATKESFKELCDKVIPPVKSFQDSIYSYRDQNLQFREIIRRFDDVLLTKASKLDITTFEDDVKNKYVAKIDFAEYSQSISTRLDEHNEYILKLEDTLDTLNKEVNKEIFAAVRRATLYMSKAMPIGKKLQEKEDVTNRDEPIKSIFQILSTKANKTDLERLNDIK